LDSFDSILDEFMKKRDWRKGFLHLFRRLIDPIGHMIWKSPVLLWLSGAGAQTALQLDGDPILLSTGTCGLLPALLHPDEPLRGPRRDRLPVG
jgi:hypothetical protein